jgi:hypothetical protein
MYMHNICACTCTFHLSPQHIMLIANNLFTATNIPRMALAATAAILSVVPLDVSNLVTIRTGGLCVKEHWINKQLGRVLGIDVLCLSDLGHFKPSGLMPCLCARDEEEEKNGGEEEEKLFSTFNCCVCVLPPCKNNIDTAFGSNIKPRISIHKELKILHIVLCN